MEQTAKKIGEGKKRAFLICDNSFKNHDSPFVNFLKDEGYTYGSSKSNFGCPWLHVDITTKQYAYGMPGVEIVGAIGDHAITIDEFMVIYEIFKKYEDKPLFVFHEERFDYDKSARILFKSGNIDQ